MATTNRINNFSDIITTTQLTIDPGASGDSYIQFEESSTARWRIGVDDDDSDTFKISQGNALGTNDYFTLDTDGIRKLPAQPAFLAQCNSELNVSGDGTFHGVGSATATTEILDQSSDFDPGDGAGGAATYTAPVDGQHIFTINLIVDIDVSGGGNQMDSRIQTSNRTLFPMCYPTANRVANFTGPNGYIGWADAGIADMDAADTCTFGWTSAGGIGSGSGNKVDDIISGYIGGCMIL